MRLYAYIFPEGAISVANMAATNNASRVAIFKNCASFNDCITEENNRQVENAKDIHVVMLMLNLIEYFDNCRERLWQYYKHDPVLNNVDTTIDFPINCNSIISFKLKKNNN